MQARIVITAALTALALAVPAAHAATEDPGGGASEPAASYVKPSARDAFTQRAQAQAAHYSTVGSTRPDDRTGIRGVGVDATRPDDRTGIRGVGVDGALAPVSTDSGIDWRELGFSGAAVLALIALFVTRMRSRQNSVTKPATLSS